MKASHNNFSSKPHSFSSEPPSNPRPSIVLKILILEDKTIVLNPVTLGHKIWIYHDHFMLDSLKQCLGSI